MRAPRVLALGFAVVFAACGGDGKKQMDQPDAAEPDAAPDAPSTAVPRIEPAACKFQVSAALAATFSCGNLIVYEDRANPTTSRTIKLHFVQFKKAATTTPNATIYLDGGPGGDGEGIVSYANFLGKPFLQGLMTDGDFLVISQRGTALSDPFLDCQQQDCADFASVADLPSYNSAYNADDVDELRATLGYTNLNIYGISYGSRLGLEVLRRHGTHVRAAVIEGLVPSQVVWPAAIPASFYSALTGLNSACAAAGACGTVYGNLVTKFTTGVDALNANPAPVNTSQGSFDLDGSTYAYLMFQLFYSKSTYPYLPLMINDLAVRRTDRIASFLESVFGGGGGGGAGISAGLYYGVVCNEIFNPPDANAFDTANANVPAAIRDLYSGSWFGLLDTCASYPKGSPTLQAQLQAPVTSNVRTFVSSGRLDPITPPTFGAIAAANLSNSFHVIHENSGHGATLQSACGQQNLFAFLADPTTPHDTSCAAAITGNFMIATSFAGNPIPTAQIRAELDMAPIPPFMRKRPKLR